MTAIPRAKRSNFTKDIPLGMEKKFAKKRISRPNRLNDPTKDSSFVTSVLQTLAASVKTHDVYKGLTAEEQKTPDFLYLSNKRSVPDMKEVPASFLPSFQGCCCPDFTVGITQNHN
jgi:hypothetical protein